jgi:cation-transporting ATPase 13A3/4/5
MSVIVKDMGSTSNRYRVHVKGSPEKLRELCQKKYIPSSFHKMLDLYAQNGFRVLAIASKTIVSDSIDSIQRDEAECDLVFLGLIIMQNKLKEITTSIIEELTAANIRSIMVTGDNVLTAISVAR